MNLFNTKKRGKLNLQRIILNGFLILSAWNLLSAQDQPGPVNQYNPAEKIYPQTPQASAFEKFISIPPGNHTGVHGFSVPIYTIQADEYSFPISIDYHGGGIKVDEISSEVGLGWNLNVGRINLSQEVRGMNDIISNKVNIENPVDFINNILPLEDNYLDAFNMLNGGQINLGISLANTDTGFEYNPDYYSYSLLNNQGKFIFDRLGEPHTIPKQAVEIQNDGTVFIDQKGVRYEFIRYLHTLNYMPAANQQIPESRSHAYRIDKIIFPKGNTLKFNYIPESYSYISDFSTTKKVFKSGNPLACIYPYSDDRHSTVRTYADIYLIESIENENTLVKFKYLSGANGIVDREDVNGGARLDKIEVYFKPASGSLQLRKEYKINTSYFTSPNADTDVPESSGFPKSNLFKRLRLDSVEELLSDQTYSFEYENAHQLPARFSYSTDHWGVYNGAPNNTPLPYYVYTDAYSGRRRLLSGGDKYPNLEYAKTGVLKKVNLPTGGSQEFEYELDQYRVPDDFELDELEEEDIRYYQEEYYLNGDYPEQLEYWYNQINYGLVAEMPLDPEYEKDFRDGFDYILTFWTNYASACDYPEDDTPGLPTEDFFQLELYEHGNNIPIRQIKCNNGNIPIAQLDPEKDYYIKIFKIANGGWSNNNFVAIELGLKWVQNDRYIVKNKETGTLRTKSITLNDSNGHPQIKRRFEYNNFEHPEYSGGMLRSRRINTEFTTSEPGNDPNPGAVDCPIYDGTCQYITLSSSPAYNLNNSFGKSVYYENVTEIYENLENPVESYKKEIEFSHLPKDDNYNDNASPLPYWTHIEYVAGKPERERLYNSADQKIKFIENFYDYDNHFNYESADHQGSVLSFGVNVALESLDLVLMDPCRYELNGKGSYYFITSAWIKLLQTREENYENGVLKMVNTTDYEYSPTYSHLNPVRSKTTNSLGQEIKTEYEYNHPYKKDEPTKVTRYENAIAQSVEQTTFYPSGLPQYIFAKKGASTLDNVPPSEDLKVTYNRYDSRGNLEQYTLADGTPVSIIWGYNGQYPIAKVEGKTYTEIASLAGTLQTASNNGTLTAGSFESLRSLGGAVVTGYIYQPLVGVTTIIQPNGQKETYEYDSFGRLKSVKDVQGNILRQIDYNYQQP